MKLKYYLRGAGIALILAVLLTHVSHENEVSASADNSMQIEEETDAVKTEQVLSETSESVEVTEENLETVTEEDGLGMSTVAELETQSIAEVMESVSEEKTESVEVVEIENADAKKAEENTTTEYVEEENQVRSTNVLMIDAGAQETYLLNIVSGDDSGTVSRKLYNAGLVDNASEFDAFLMQHGYDKKIRVGTVEVPIGSTWLEIAEKLAGK